MEPGFKILLNRVSDQTNCLKGTASGRLVPFCRSPRYVTRQEPL